MRGHPSVSEYDLDKHLKNYFENSPNFSVSLESSLSASLDLADVVIYRGTTAVFTALYMGVPLIHCQSSEWIESEDPLFKFNNLKFIINKPSDIKETLVNIQSIKQGNFEEQHKLAREYVLNYLEPYTKNILDNFF